VNEPLKPCSPLAKLTMEQARQLRADREFCEPFGRGMTVSELARKYALSYDGVRSILQGRVYKE
jgi:Mor family transcriptional regulator